MNKNSFNNDRSNWYGIEEGNYKIKDMMIQYDELLHEYSNEDRKCEVWVKDGVFGIRKFQDNVWQEDKLIENHNEMYAENAAENWVLRVNS